jgi:hypothetical protein
MIIRKDNANVTKHTSPNHHRVKYEEDDPRESIGYEQEFRLIVKSQGRAPVDLREQARVHAAADLNG